MVFQFSITTKKLYSNKAHLGLNDVTDAINILQTFCLRNSLSCVKSDRLKSKSKLNLTFVGLDKKNRLPFQALKRRWRETDGSEKHIGKPPITFIFSYKLIMLN